MKFSKENAQLKWSAQLKELTNIRGYDFSDDGSLFVCGDNFKMELLGKDPAEADYNAGIAFLTSEGDITNYVYTQGRNQREPRNIQDRCMGIAQDKKTKQVVALLQSKNDRVRMDNKSGVNPADNLYNNGFYDTMLIIFSPDGYISQEILYPLVTITQHETYFNMYSANNGLIFGQDSDVYFAGWSYGYQTKYQTVDQNQNLWFKNPEDLDYDVYVYKYDIDHLNNDLTSDYLYEKKHSMTDFWGFIMWSQLSSSSDRSKVITLSRQNDEVPKRQTQDYLTAGVSRYSGGFETLDTMKIPRASAYLSLNLTHVEYYRGQNTMKYDILEENLVTFDYKLFSNPQVLYQDGTSATPFATIDQDTFTVLIQTDDEDMVGVHRLIIQDYDERGRLLELNLYVQVLSNTHPYFVTEPDTSFTLAVGDVISYKLPPVGDPDGNDIPVVYIDKMDTQEDRYPPFLLFDNNTYIITMMPDSQWV